MSSAVVIDKIDVQILLELMLDARKTLAEIAKQCSLSSVAVLNHVKRLKAAGVITGTMLLCDMSVFGYMYPATVDISIKPSQERNLIRHVAGKVSVVMQERTIGKDNLMLFVVAKSLHELNTLRLSIKGQPGVRRVVVNIWSTPHLVFKNINLQPTRA